MVSREQVATAIDIAVAEFELSWATLVKLKTRDLPDTPDQVLDFQSNLASTLYRLNQVHTELAREKRARIRHKDSFQKDWFNSRMAKLASYQDAIKNAISIGKSLGNSFAWIFYANDRILVNKHHQHPPNFYMSTGFGGPGHMTVDTYGKKNLDF